MSWKETGRVSERERFVKCYEETGAMSALCREFGISRKTGCKGPCRSRRAGRCSALRLFRSLKSRKGAGVGW